MASINDRAIDEVMKEQDKYNIHDMIPIVKNNVKLQLSGKEMYIPCLAGNPGMGKTSLVKQLAEDMNLNMLYFSMNHPYEAFTGLPAMNNITFGDDSNRNNLYVYWSEPELVHIANELARDPNKNGSLVFLDDMHIMAPDVQKCFFEFVLERKLGNYRLDKNVAIVGAMNSSSMAGFDGFFSAINNRIMRMNVKMEFDYWYKNMGAELNPLIAIFVRQFQSDLEEKESTDQPFATYRCWCQVSEMLNEPYSEYLKNKDDIWFLRQVAMISRGFMSKEKSIALTDHIKNQLRYNFDEMVKNNKFYIDVDDPISQFCFGNIIRYLRDEKDVKNLSTYILNLIKNNSNDLSNYQNAIMNIMYELISFTNSLQRKSDNNSKERLALLRQLQTTLFREGAGKMHAMLADTMNIRYNSSDNN